jgi:hypothetical protein
LTRIADVGSPGVGGTLVLDGRFGTRARPRAEWNTGDYVVGRVLPDSPLKIPFELSSGRLVEVAAGDRIVGALGTRAATLEVVGDWRAIGEDGVFEALTPAGLMGRTTSKSDTVPDPIRLSYEGHFTIDGRAACMDDYVPREEPAPFDLPVVLIVGSSMSAGKTTTGRVIVHTLCAARRRVVAAKLTGAGRYRDVLSLGDAGAEWIFDFVDAGLPSSVCESEDFRTRLEGLLGRIASTDADVAVFEAGASPLEPYNGATAFEALAPHVRCMVLCASDPYAVVGIIDAFGRKPDLVAGPTANTEAGIALVKKLSGLQALDARSPVAMPELERVLGEALGETGA